MARLVNITESISSSHINQATLLQQARNMTNEILDTLDTTASSAASLNDSIFSQHRGVSWWPFVLCPTASLVMGSYGLAPSALRNLGLVVLGEAVGLVVSTFQGTDVHILSSFANAYGSNTTWTEI